MLLLARRAAPVVGGVAIAATLLLSGCADPTPVVTGGGTLAASPSSGATPAPSTTTGAGGSASAPAATSAKPTTAFPGTTIAVGHTITDTGLGHTIVVSRILRGLPWPAGYASSAQAFELVAVEMTWTPSTTFTAPIRKQDFSIRTGSSFPSRPEPVLDKVMVARKFGLLPAQVDSGATATGWVVFKVDPKGAPNLTLDYTRPKSEVTDSGEVFASRVFSTVLVGAQQPAAPTPAG